MMVSGLAQVWDSGGEGTTTYGTTKSERTTLEDMVRIGEMEIWAPIAAYAGASMAATPHRLARNIREILGRL